MPEIIFTTVHGSRLYGFAHDGSDYDTFTVTDSRRMRTRQVVDDAGNDRVTVGLWHFLDLASSGSHQSVEALYSPVKEWADNDVARRYGPLLRSVRVGGGEVASKYERTIRKFAYGDRKRRRHAARLKLNLDDLRDGHTPRIQLHPTVAAWCGRVADEYEGDALARYLHVFKESG
jgi:hypothetical protein